MKYYLYWPGDDDCFWSNSEKEWTKKEFAQTFSSREKAVKFINKTWEPDMPGISDDIKILNEDELTIMDILE